MGSKWEEICPVCGAKYSELRTGETFDSIKAMLWSGSDDPKTWRYKRRNTVLGLWHQLKQELWHAHLEMCEAIQLVGCARMDRFADKVFSKFYGD